MNELGIKTQKQANCPVCKNGGTMVYRELVDHLYAAPGKWDMQRCDNQQCRTLWVDPKPVETDLPSLYEDYYTHPTGSSRDKGKDLYRQIVNAHCQRKFGGVPQSAIGLKQRLKSFILYLFPPRACDADSRAMSLKVKPGGRLLEVGFGDGEALYCLSSLGWNCEGIDFDSKSVEAAKRAGMSVSRGGLETAGYSAESFEAIVSQHVIEHLYDARVFLDHCHKYLKPGGDLVIYTPNADSLVHRIFGRTWRGLEVPRHLQIFTLSSLKRIVEDTGFTIISNNTSGRGGVTIYESLRLRSGRDVNNKSRLLIEIFNLVEWLISKVGSNLGAEIRLHAKKQPNKA